MGTGVYMKRKIVKDRGEKAALYEAPAAPELWTFSLSLSLSS